jgi:phosphomevalonate kinase
MTEAHAPGKLVIVGEYAVLHGASALAVAVDARARIQVSPLSAETGQLLTGPAPPASFRWWCDGTLRWEGSPPGAHGRPLESVLAALAAAGELSAAQELPTCRIVIGSEEFHSGPGAGPVTKLGLGSSAAVTVALTGALLRVFERQVPHARLLELCLDAHRRLQGGLGSGIDVVASLSGGVIAREAGGGLLPVPWPRHLGLLAIWTGAGASTTDLLRRYEAWQQHAPAAFAAQLERMQAIAQLALQSWRAADLPRLLQAIEAYDEALLQLDAAAGIGIYTPVHRRLRELARRHELVYKPSGAGGGDFGIALGTDQAALDRLQGDCAAEGLMVLDLPLCARGLVVH